MRKMKRIFLAVIFTVLFLCCGYAFKYMLVDDTGSFTRIMMHELYNQEENIDVLFVGSSHSYRSVDTSITDEIFGKNTFNAGSSSQFMDASEAIIREALTENDIETIYLELYFEIAASAEYSERTDMVATHLISDYMKPSWNKLKFLLNASGKEQYINSFFKTRRNWKRFYDADYVLDVVKKKGTVDYKNYEYTYVTFEESAYKGKGFVACYNSELTNFFYTDMTEYKINVDTMSKDWEQSLKNIMKVCEEKGIDLILYSAPMPDFLVASAGHYDDYIAKIRELTQGTSVLYYDFNLCKEEYFSYAPENFYDIDHLNYTGARNFSEVMAKFFTGQIAEEDLFYSSYKEKVESVTPRYLGVSYQDINDVEEEKRVRNMKIVSMNPEEMVYRIIITPRQGEQYWYQDFEKNDQFTVKLSGGGTCTIQAKKKGEDNSQVQTIEIEY